MESGDTWLADERRPQSLTRLVAQPRPPGDAAKRAASLAARRAQAAAAEREAEEAREALVAARGDPQAAGEALIAAVKDGRAGAVHELLAAGVPVNRKTADGNTALHWAAQRGAEHTTGLLLAKGAAVGVSNRDGWAPLDLAAYHGHGAVVAKLLDGGADPSALEAVSNKTPLHWAALNGHAEAAAVLLAGGAEADAQNHEGTTPLAEAAAGGHVTVMRLLLDAGASPDGTPALASELALASKSISAAVRLNCGGFFDWGAATQVTAEDPEDAELPEGFAEAMQSGQRRGPRRGAPGGASPLHWAVRRAARAGGESAEAAAGCVEAVGLLLSAGATVDAADGAGETPLHKAAACGDAEVCEALIAAGAALEVRSRAGVTPLRAAAAAGQVVTCMVLLAAGADAGEQMDATSAAAAATGDAAQLLQHCRTWCAQALAARPAEQRGWLAATRCLQKAAVRVMVMRKAHLDGCMSDEDLERASSLTVDAVVAEAQLESIAHELEAGKMGRSTAKEAAEEVVAPPLDPFSAVGLRKTFATYGLFAPPTAEEEDELRGTEGESPLHRAASRGDAEACLELLGAGADPAALDGAGRTPLHAAAAAGSVQTCKVLLAGGSPLLARCNARAAGYASGERVSQLVYATAAAFAGGSPLDVATGDAVAFLRDAGARERTKATKARAAEKSAGTPPKWPPERRSSGSVNIAAQAAGPTRVPARPLALPAPGQRALALAGSPPLDTPATRAAAARAMPIKAQSTGNLEGLGGGGGGMPLPPRPTPEAAAGALAKAHAAVNAAAAALAAAEEAEAEAAAEAFDEPTPSARAAAAAALRVLAERQEALAVAREALGRAKERAVAAGVMLMRGGAR